MNQYYIAWWNLENLFDIDNSASRPAWLQKELKSELKGWDQTILDRKISQLAKIIQQMNQGTGPDILGVCEVENKPVLDLLINSLQPLGRNYDVAHHDTSDQRGIDVAFIYDKSKFDYEGQFFCTILKRTATRDIFQVNLKTIPGGNPLILIGNHWPARVSGELDTEPYRIIAAETLSYWNKRIMDIRGNDISIVVMGDFNDEPYNRSLTQYALSSNNKMKVVKSKTPRLYNLMWPFMGQGIGTHYYNNFPNVLDQFMVSKAIVNGNGKFKVKQNGDDNYCVNIEMFPEIVSTGYPDPIRFGRPSKGLNKDGFSDHYPISMVLEEV